MHKCNVIQTRINVICFKHAVHMHMYFEILISMCLGVPSSRPTLLGRMLPWCIGTGGSARQCKARIVPLTVIVYTNVLVLWRNSQILKAIAQVHHKSLCSSADLLICSLNPSENVNVM